MPDSDAKELPAAEFSAALKKALAAKDAEALTQLASGAVSKAQRKELARAAHRLRSQGVEAVLPAEATKSPPKTSAQTQIAAAEAFTTSIDGLGGRMIWLVVDAPGGGREVLAIYLDDEVGLKKIDVGHASRKNAKAMVNDMLSQKQVPIAALDPAYARALLEEAAERTRAKGRAQPEGHAVLSERLKALAPPVSLDPHPAEALAKETDERELLQAARASSELLVHSPFSGWGPGQGRMRELAGRVEAVEASTVIVTPAQRMEQLETIFAKAAQDELAGEGRTRWARRLREAAWVAHLLGEEEFAAKVATLARALQRVKEEVPVFLSLLLRRPFGEYIARRFEAGGAGPKPPAPEEPKPAGKGKIILPR